MADARQNPPLIGPAMQTMLPPLPQARDRRKGGPFIPTNKIKIRWVRNGSRRRSTLKKRRDNILKKAEELHILCNVQVSAIIFSPEEDEPVVFPSVDRAASMCRTFMELPHFNRSHLTRSHQQFLQEMLDKKKKKVWNKQEEIDEKETRALVYETLAGGDIIDVNSEKLREMRAMMEKMYIELYPRSSRAQRSTPPVSSPAPRMKPSGFAHSNRDQVNE